MDTVLQGLGHSTDHCLLDQISVPDICRYSLHWKLSVTSSAGNPCQEMNTLSMSGYVRVAKDKEKDEGFRV